ncbi:phytoene desaturase, partial [bacterium]|nr:phytoene desaturase [bacterium]
MQYPNDRKVIVVGAGPGGLTAGMILASKGFNVEIFESKDRVGGRNAGFKLGDFIFDTGPTFLMMKFILKDMFELAGRRIEDYLEIIEVDPMYRLSYADGTEFFPSHKNRDWTIDQIEELFPGNGVGYLKFLQREGIKYERLAPCLEVPYEHKSDLLSKRLRHAAPYLDAHVNLFQNLRRYYDDERLKIAFTFQTKYLGMSPWECPALFGIISYIEHSGGIWHPIGGLHKISEAMAQIIEEDGGKINLSTSVDEVLVKDGNATGIRLESGDIVEGDYVFINADFGYAINNLIKPENLDSWSPEVVSKKRLSCSTFMLYLGVDKTFDNIPHHNIIFPEDYKRNVTEIAEEKVLSDQ